MKKLIIDFDQFVNEMYMGPANGAKSTADHMIKQQKLGYYPKAVSSEPGGFGNGGNSGAPEVAEDRTPTPLSQRLGNIEPEAYPSSAGQDFAITQPGSAIVSHDNMRGEPKLTTIR